MSNQPMFPSRAIPERRAFRCNEAAISLALIICALSSDLALADSAAAPINAGPSAERAAAKDANADSDRPKDGASQQGIAVTQRSAWGRRAVDEAPKLPASPEDLALEDAVRAAAITRWHDILAGRWENAYNAFSPSSRATITIEAFRRGLEGQPLKFMQIGTVECRHGICSARVVLEYSVRVPRIGAQPAPLVRLERWRKIDGKVYLLAETG
jgi:hypothetical protein